MAGIDADLGEARSEVAAQPVAHSRRDEVGTVRGDEGHLARVSGEGGRDPRHLAPGRDRGGPREAEPHAAVGRLLEEGGEVLLDRVARMCGPQGLPGAAGLLHRGPSLVAPRLLGLRPGPPGGQRHGRIEQHHAPHPLRGAGGQVQRQEAAEGVAGDHGPPDALRVERGDQVVDVLLDAPRGIPRRASVPAQVGRQDAHAGELGLGEAAVARPGVGDPVDHEQRRSAGRPPGMDVERGHRGNPVIRCRDRPGYRGAPMLASDAVLP